MKDVGLFTDRIEITHKTKTDEELEDELQKKLERYMGSALVVDNVDEMEDDDKESLESVANTPQPPRIDEADALIRQLTPKTHQYEPAST